jgi:hypothetical protein
MNNRQSLPQNLISSYAIGTQGLWSGKESPETFRTSAQYLPITRYQVNRALHVMHVFGIVSISLHNIFAILRKKAASENSGLHF